MIIQKILISNTKVLHLHTTLNDIIFSVNGIVYTSLSTQYTPPNLHAFFFNVQISKTKLLLIGISYERYTLIKNNIISFKNCIMLPERKAKVYICTKRKNDIYHGKRIRKSINLICYFIRHKLFMRGVKNEFSR